MLRGQAAPRSHCVLEMPESSTPQSSGSSSTALREGLQNYHVKAYMHLSWALDTASPKPDLGSDEDLKFKSV